MARTVEFKLTQCIFHKKMTIKIIYTDQTGPDSVEQTGPDRADQGIARQERATPGRMEQCNARQGRAGPRRASRVNQDRTGSYRTGPGLEKAGLNWICASQWLKCIYASRWF